MTGLSFEIEKLHPEHGDLIIVRTSADTDPTLLEQMAEELSALTKRLPSNVVMALVPDDYSFERMTYTEASRMLKTIMAAKVSSN